MSSEGSINIHRENTYVISGAGSGIGKAVVLEIAKQFPNSNLVLVGRRLEKLEEIEVFIDQMVLDSKPHITLINTDISDPTGLKNKLSKLNLMSTQVQGIVSCAGVGGENHHGDQDRWEQIIGTNLSGTYYLIQQLLPFIKKSTNDYRNIIVISSILARLGIPNYSAYCASKAGLLGLVRSLASELASEKILVNAICPGWVDTEMAKQGIETFATASGVSFESGLKSQMDRVPLRKMSTPAEIAALVVFLLTNKQTSITGQSIDINNGAWMGV